MNAQTITATDRRRLSAQCTAILERLQRGPATNAELSAISLKYTSRVSDLRAAGHNVVCVRGGEGGVNTYRLAPAPVAFDGRQAVMFGEWQGGEIDPVWGR